ncbi:hypothetical protein GT755_01675 [Herbidospora sp. NEAU-GS84]|uniref:Uncharacterized protein n=1 Tax=Herbidospora solisilvae TaxID=2696284 RepID=A0A7C9MUB2_9ACTN|nr:hypothetical protein [Herbidospora solisilvae]NAS20391.1 hypothetical protein [Herbidospora solisilvae]
MKIVNAGLVLLSGLLLAAVPAAPANARAAKCTLSILDLPDGFHRIDVRCTPVPGEQLDVIRLMGSDGWSGDDRLYTYYTHRTVFSRTIHGNYLDEDQPAAQDDIYAKVWFRRPNGSLYTVNTNQWHGYYGGWGLCCTYPGEWTEPGY